MDVQRNAKRRTFAILESAIAKVHYVAKDNHCYLSDNDPIRVLMPSSSFSSAA